MLRSLLVLFLAAFAGSLKVPVPGEQTGRRSALASAAALALLPAMKANAAPGATPIWGYNKKKITPPPGSWKYCDTLKCVARECHTRLPPPRLEPLAESTPAAASPLCTAPMWQAMCQGCGHPMGPGLPAVHEGRHQAVL